MDENNVVNWATPLVNPMAVASRSLTKFPAFPASNAIDRNSLTRSEADAEDGVQQWWEVDLGEAHTVGEVCIENVYCGDPSDAPGCRCKLTDAYVDLYGENNVFITRYPLGDTCGQAEIEITYQPDAKFCEGTVLTAADSAVDETAVADDAGTDVISAASEPTYSPSYVPSAQPVFTAVAAADSAPGNVVTEDRCFVTDPTDLGKDDGKRGWYDVSGCGVCNDYCCTISIDPDVYFSCKLAGTTYEYTASDRNWGTPDNVFSWPMCSRKGQVLLNQQHPLLHIHLATCPQPSGGFPMLGHAYSAGDVCEDDTTLESNKGITCKPFAYAETVHCRSPTGFHDESFEALRYGDFCPKTCGMCVDLAASSSVEGDDGESKGVAIGVGSLIVMLLAWMCCHSNYTGKSNNVTTSEFRDNSTQSQGQHTDNVGGSVQTVETSTAKSAAEEVVPNTEIV